MNPSTGPTPETTVYVASFNTASSTELCIRTCRSYAGVDHRLVVGDAGSTDGTRRMLRRVAHLAEAELADERRAHHEWLDHWREVSPARFCVFVDSDIEFLRPGWLAEMVNVAESEGAALVTGEWVSPGKVWTEPDGVSYPIAPRPAPWLLLLDLSQVQAIDCGFSFQLDTDREPSVGHDVGGAFWNAAVETGMTTAVMPGNFRTAFRHYGGMTERTGRRYESAGRRFMRRALVRSRLVQHRVRAAALGFRHGSTDAQGPHEPEAA